jgi:DNA repair protein SbcD/Mre11
MKILHTSDWHLGRSLYDKKRYDEFEAFLNWLAEFIAFENIDLLLVAGDIFDSSTPSNRAQELYYSFLWQISQSCCRHVVIIGGNHDSPTFLDAPKNLLNMLNIKVVGATTGNTAEEIFVLKNRNNETEAIVCAVPFLRDRDIRTAEAGESPEDKTRNLLENISSHYKEVANGAHKLQDKKNMVPVIGMGHLFTRNGRTSEGDGVRELYIGNIAHIDGEDISEGFDYMALGHLHLAQKAGDSETVRYSGSPLPMGFAEADQAKKVIVADFRDQTLSISECPVPCFRELIRLTGDIQAISDKIVELKSTDSKAWLEIEITSLTVATMITAHFDELLKGSGLEILRIKNKNIIDRALTPLADNETLETLSDSDVFKRCLEAYEISGEECALLTDTYNEAIASLMNADTNAV